MLRHQLFHHFEIAISGYSGSGKTTLIMSLIDELSSKYKVGYVKHDAHRFEMDGKGKDTYRAVKAGASLVTIHNEEKWCDQGAGVRDIAATRISQLDNDFVIIEGHKKSKCQKIIVLGEGETKEKILADYNSKDLENVLAFVGVDDKPNLENINLPYFNRDDIKGISNFILNLFEEKVKNTPVYGLVLAGGKSTRMKKDKGAIQYFDLPQSEHITSMLKNVCEKVFISCREDQSQEDHLINLDQIHDTFSEIGPSGGILSAMKKYPEAAWIVIACDLPYVNEKTLSQLVNERNPLRLATCFLNPEKKWPEPLCTIYEPKSYARLLQFVSIGYTCPRKVLFNSHIKSLELNQSEALRNANTPEDFNLAKAFIQEKGEAYYASKC